MATVTPETRVDIIFEVGQDINDLDDWGFDLKKWLEEIAGGDSLQSVTWALPPGLVTGPLGDGVTGTLAYVWIDSSGATDDTEYQCIADMVTAGGRKLRARLDVLVRDVTAEP